MKISILGASGGIGQPLSLLLKTKLPANFDLAVYDVSPVNVGVAVDISHIPRGAKVKGYSADNIKDALSGADLVLISAGVARKPNMDRADLFNINASIIRDIANECALACPDAFFCIITNPVNTTVPIFSKVLENHNVLNPNKVFGVTTLDVIRSKTFVAEHLNLKESLFSVRVIGGHSGTTILPLLSQLNHKIEQSAIESLTSKIQNAGTEVVNAKAGGGSATLSMAYAAYQFALSLVRALQGADDVVECAYVAGGVGACKYFAQPVKINAHGIESYLGYGAVSSYEQKSIDSMINTLAAEIKKGEDFAVP